TYQSSSWSPCIEEAATSEISQACHDCRRCHTRRSGKLMIRSFKKGGTKQTGKHHFHPAFGDAASRRSGHSRPLALNVHKHSGSVEMCVSCFVDVVNSAVA